MLKTLQMIIHPYSKASEGTWWCPETSSLWRQVKTTADWIRSTWTDSPSNDYLDLSKWCQSVSSIRLSMSPPLLTGSLWLTMTRWTIVLVSLSFLILYLLSSLTYSDWLAEDDDYDQCPSSWYVEERERGAQRSFHSFSHFHSIISKRYILLVFPVFSRLISRVSCITSVCLSFKNWKVIFPTRGLISEIWLTARDTDHSSYVCCGMREEPMAHMVIGRTDLTWRISPR